MSKPDDAFCAKAAKILFKKLRKEKAWEKVIKQEVHDDENDSRLFRTQAAAVFVQDDGDFDFVSILSVDMKVARIPKEAENTGTGEVEPGHAGLGMDVIT